MDTISITDEKQSAMAATVAGLRALADLLEQNPHLETPMYEYGQTELCYVGTCHDPKAALRNWARATSHMRPAKSYGNGYATLKVDFGGGVVVDVYADRAQVCERVVKGTREVTKTVKDPEALAAVPEVEVTVTEEDVEWICRPLLADEVSA